VDLWQLLTYTPTITPTGYVLTVVTDVACHLYLRWSDSEPHIHTHPVVLRGLRVRDDLDYCFTVYWDVEQTEPGDTTTHTFTIDPFPDCTTKYFYFFATIAGAWSPSTSAIFTLKRGIVHIAPAQVMDFYASSALHRVFMDAWYDEGDWVQHNLDVLASFTYYTLAFGYSIRRGCMVFNLYNIEHLRPIKQCLVNMWIPTPPAGGEDGLYVLYPVDLTFPAVKENFGKMRSATWPLKYYTPAEVAVGGWYTWPLLARHYDLLHPNGISWMITRTLRDYTAQPPPDPPPASHGCSVSSFEDPNYPPWLLIETTC